jgi:hypothetical protein
MQQQFRDYGCPAKVYFGKEFLAEHASPPRVVWVPTSDTYELPIQNQAAGSPPAPSATGTNPRPIWIRWAGAELHIWGAAKEQEKETRQREKDQSVMDALVNQTIVALQKLVPGYYRLQGGMQTPSPTAVRKGFVYILRVQIAVPIVDIDFPCDAIDTTVFTWTTASDVSGDITVEERLSLPTGPLLDAVEISTSEES